MILFLVALSAEWWHPGDLVSWVSIGAVMVVIFTLSGWCIWTVRERSLHWWFQADPVQPLLSIITKERSTWRIPSRSSSAAARHYYQGEGDAEVSDRSWLTKRIHRFVGTWFKIPKEGERSVQGSDRRHISVSLPDCDSPPNEPGESVQIHVPDRDAGVHRDTEHFEAQ